MKNIKLAVACLIIAFASVANASTITLFTSVINGEQIGAGTGSGSLATGSANMMLDHDTGVFSWNVTWQDINSLVFATHFHGPAPPGMDAFIEIIFDYTTNPSIGSAILTDQQMTDVLAGLWYINIHTTDFVNGEIRGQVLVAGTVPIPAAIWLFCSGLIGLRALGKHRNIP